MIALSLSPPPFFVDSFFDSPPPWIPLGGKSCSACFPSQRLRVLLFYRSDDPSSPAARLIRHDTTLEERSLSVALVFLTPHASSQRHRSSPLPKSRSGQPLRPEECSYLAELLFLSPSASDPRARISDLFHRAPVFPSSQADARRPLNVHPNRCFHSSAFSVLRIRIVQIE